VDHGGRRYSLPPPLASGAGFQKLKSLFQINVLKGTRPERILCLIYGRLIVILVVQRLLALASAQAAAEQRELSYCKATQWLMRGGRLLQAFLDRQFGGLLRRMMFRLKRLLKQKRKRLTTWQLIARQVPYLDSFAGVDHFVARSWSRLDALSLMRMGANPAPASLERVGVTGAIPLPRPDRLGIFPMSHYRCHYVPGGSFFFTVVTDRRAPILETT